MPSAIAKTTKPIRSLLAAQFMLVFLGAIVLVHAPAAATQPIVYSRSSDDPRWDYAIRVIELAIDRSGRDYKLQATKERMTQARAARELEAGRIDFIWAGTSADYEQRFRPIRVPLLRGLEGYRICVINADQQPAFSAIQTIDDLKRFSIGQGQGWSDVTILEAAGFMVVTALSNNLPAMLEHRRFDCFLRGVHEARGDVARYKAEHASLAVESDVMLVYPFASFFFVNKDNAALAEALESGLKKAYEDGSFMALFNSHPAIKSIFADTRMEQRRRFDVPNPLLTEAIWSVPDHYWHGRPAMPADRKQ